MGRPMLPRRACAQCGFVCTDRRSRYCSRACRGAADRGRAAPHAVGNKWNFKGDAAGTWAHYKRMQKLCPPGPCVKCGSVAQSVIHHKDHNPRNTVPDNLERRCRACHAAHHHTRNANATHATAAK